MIYLFRKSGLFCFALLTALAGYFAGCSGGNVDVAVNTAALEQRAYAVMDSILHVDNVIMQGKAISFLRTIGTPRSREILVSALILDNETVRRDASFALGSLGETSAYDSVLAALRNPNWFIRLTAIQYARFLPPEKSIPAIAPLLADSYQPVLKAIVNTFAYINNPEALEYLKKMALSKSREIREDAYRELAALHSGEALSFIASELRSEDREYVRNVLMYISRSPDSTLAPIIAGFAGSEDVIVRRLVAVILGSYDSQFSRSVLLGMLSDEDGSVRNNAACSLGQLKVPESIPVLTAALEREWQTQSSLFWNALTVAVDWERDEFKKAVLELYKRIPSENPLKITVACVLLHMGDRRGVPLIDGAIGGETDNILNALIKGLEFAKNESFIPFLLKFTGHKFEPVRDRAESILAHYEDDRVLEYFHDYYGTENIGKLRLAVSVFGQWVPENARAEKYLIEALHHTSDAARESAAFEAGERRILKALPSLENLLSDSRIYVQMNAAWAVLYMLNGEKDKPLRFGE